MLKKSLLFLLTGLFVFINIARAEHIDIDDVKVSLRNLGSDECKLVKKIFIDGYLFESQLPQVLPADGEILYFTVSGNGNIDFNLTYECGEYKKATLHIIQYHKKRHRHTTTEFSLLNQVNIFEWHKIVETESSFCARQCLFENGHKYPARLDIRLMH